MSGNWQDKLSEPHHFTEGQLLRRFLLCLIALAALLAGVIYANAQPAPKLETDVVSACSVDGTPKCAQARSMGHITGLTCVEHQQAGAGNQDRPRADSTFLKAALGSYLTFSVIDAKQTGSCLAAGTCVERNPILRPFAGRPSALVTAKLAANSATAYGIWRLRKKHPKAALVLAIAAAGFQAVVITSNARQQ